MRPRPRCSVRGCSSRSRLHLDAAITLLTAPGSGSRHWRQAIAFLDQDRPVRRGESLHLTVGHADSHFFFFGWRES
jgi:hypothetical protein